MDTTIYKKKMIVKKEKPKKKGMVLSVIFMVALIVVTFAVIFKDNSLADIINIVKTVNPWFLSCAFLMAGGYMLFQALTFKLPLNRLGVKRSIWNNLGFAFVGVYFSGITPSATGGQPMQLYYMKRNGISTADASLTLLMTNIAYQAVVMLYGIVMLILRWNFVSGTVAAMKVLIIVGYLIAGAVLLGLMFVTFSKGFAEKAVRFFINILSKMKIIKDREKTLGSAEEQLSEYKKGAAAMRQDPRMFLGTLGMTFLQMTCYFLVPFFIYKAFGLSGANIFDLLALQAILFMAVSYLPLPGAVGATEKGFVTLFTTFFSGALVVPAMLLSRGITFYFLMIVSGVVVLIMQMRGKREYVTPSAQE